MQKKMSNKTTKHSKEGKLQAAINSINFRKPIKKQDNTKQKKEVFKLNHEKYWGVMINI